MVGTNNRGVIYSVNEITMEIILGIYIVLVVLGVLLLIRNQQVYDFRIKLLNKMSENYQGNHEKFWEMRNAFYEVSYDEMLFKFWKPLDSFYDMSKFE